MRWAIVDILTTGLHVVHDRIIEIAVRIIDDKGLVCDSHQLINPERSVPAPISALTGITNDRLESALPFEAHADALFNLLQGCILVAHNARFEFGFLKNSFKRAGLAYKSPVLCTIKLMKKLIPDLPACQLDFLATHFNIENPKAHGALSDAETLHALITELFKVFSRYQVVQVAQSIYQQSSIPTKLVTDVSAFPNSPGVYLFYAKNSTTPMYIGKSVTLRQRIMSHFQASHAHAKEFAMAQQVERVEIIPTAGELSALLLESELIKEHMPVYNRRLRRAKVCVGIKVSFVNGYATLTLERYTFDDETGLKPDELYGTFKSQSAAKHALLTLVKDYSLCPKLAQLERSATACFSYQLKRCRGACVNEESRDAYNQRVYQALNELREATWPYAEAIAIKEHCPVNQMTQFLIFNQWRYSGMVNHESQLRQWHKLPAKKAIYHYDAYKIVLRFMTNTSIKEVIDLNALSQGV